MQGTLHRSATGSEAFPFACSLIDDSRNSTGSVTGSVTGFSTGSSTDRRKRFHAIRRRTEIWVLLSCLVATGCTTTRTYPNGLPAGPVSITTESPQTYYVQEPDEIDLIPADELPYEGLVLEDASGNLRKFYYLRPKRFKAVKDLITKFTGIPADRIESDPAWGETGAKGSPGFELMLVTGTEDDFIRLDTFLDSLEAHVPMIEIEAQIVELLNTDGFALGVQTLISEIANNGGPNDETLFDDLRGVFDTTEFAQADLVGSEFQGFLMNLSTLHDEFRWDVLIQALATKRLANILSAPKITVLNGFKAEIVVGDEVPVQTFKSVAGTALIDITFKQAAVKLSVTPMIVGKDTIRMEILPEVSRITGFTDAGPRGLSNPIISTRNASTVVNIRNGYTYVIGGLIGNTEIKDERKTPILGDLPIIKHLFRTTSSTKTDTNLLFMIKPKIIYPEFYGEASDRIFDPEIPIDDDEEPFEDE